MRRLTDRGFVRLAWAGVAFYLAAAWAIIACLMRWIGGLPW